MGVMLGFYWFFFDVSPDSLTNSEFLHLCIDGVIFFGVERLLYYGLGIGYEKQVHWCITFLLAFPPTLGVIFLYRWARIFATFLL